MSHFLLQCYCNLNRGYWKMFFFLNVTIVHCLIIIPKTSLLYNEYKMGSMVLLLLEFYAWSFCLSQHCTDLETTLWNERKHSKMRCVHCACFYCLLFVFFSLCVVFMSDFEASICIWNDKTLLFLKKWHQ